MLHGDSNAKYMMILKKNSQYTCLICGYDPSCDGSIPCNIDEICQCSSNSHCLYKAFHKQIIMKGLKIFKTHAFACSQNKL